MVRVNCKGKARFTPTRTTTTVVVSNLDLNVIYLSVDLYILTST